MFGTKKSRKRPRPQDTDIWENICQAGASQEVDQQEFKREIAKMAYRLGPGFPEQVRNLKRLIEAEKKRRGI